MSIKSILVATDLSERESSAVLRARQLANAHDATLELAALSPTADSFDALVEKARGVDLVVLPDRHDTSIAAFFRGQLLGRLLRAGGPPVLVVRMKGSTPYRRIVVPVDFSDRSAALVTLAAQLDRDAELRVVHALGTRDEARLASAGVTHRVLQIYRERNRHDAQSRMLQLRGELATHGSRLFTKIGRGDPARQAVSDQERSGADLVVVAKRQASAWVDFAFGSVAQRVLSWGRSDVLVVPTARMKRRSTDGNRGGAPARTSINVFAPSPPLTRMGLTPHHRGEAP